jgi:hypothetical protein
MLGGQGQQGKEAGGSTGVRHTEKQTATTTPPAPGQQHTAAAAAAPPPSYIEDVGYAQGLEYLLAGGVVVAAQEQEAGDNI